MPRTSAAKLPPNKHQLKSEATLHRFHGAALQIFSRDGFEAARIDDIAAAAGYTRGAFYAHFKSKEDLFFAMLENESQRHLDRVQKSLEECRDDEQRIRTLRDFYVSKLSDRRWSILTLEFKLYALRHPRLRARLAEMHRSIRNKVKLQGVPVMHYSQETEPLLRLSLQAILHGLVLETSYDPAGLSEADSKEILKTVFDALIAEFIRV